MTWPLVLHHDDAQRIAHATVVILTRKIEVGVYDIVDALVIRQNERRRKIGAQDAGDATVAHIEITTITVTTLGALDIAAIKQAGWKDRAHLIQSWERRGRSTDAQAPIKVCAFKHTEPPPRFMHVNPASGYTTDPRRAVIEERLATEVLAASDLAVLAADNTRRYQAEHNEDLRRRRAQSIAQLAKDAARRGDIQQARALHAEVNRLVELIERA